VNEKTKRKRKQPKTMPEQVKARQDYTAENVDELTFSKGDVITVESSFVDHSSEWWLGELNGQNGKFMKALVKVPKSGRGQKSDEQTGQSEQMMPQPPNKTAESRKKRMPASNARKLVGADIAPDCDAPANPAPSAELLKEVEKLKLELEFQKFKEAQQKGKNRRKRKNLKKQQIAATRLQAICRGHRTRANMDLEDDDGDDIDSLVGHRVKRGQMQLRVRWKGAGSEEDEWFPLSALLEEHGHAVKHFLLLHPEILQ
jgi:hypothetical protein